MTENHQFESTGGTTVTLDPSTVSGQRFSDGHRNAQIDISGLGGGSYTVSIRQIGSSHWVEHVSGAGEDDTVIIAGDRAPIFEAIRITFANVPALQVSTINLSTWARMI